MNIFIKDGAKLTGNFKIRRKKKKTHNLLPLHTRMGFPGGAIGKEHTCLCRLDVRDSGWIPGLGDSLEEGTATQSSILAWRISWTGEPGGLWSIGSHRVGCD